MKGPVAIPGLFHESCISGRVRVGATQRSQPIINRLDSENMRNAHCRKRHSPLPAPSSASRAFAGIKQKVADGARPKPADKASECNDEG